MGRASFPKAKSEKLIIILDLAIGLRDKGRHNIQYQPEIDNPTSDALTIQNIDKIAQVNKDKIISQNF